MLYQYKFQMKTALSIESYTPLKKTARNRCNPESSTNLTASTHLNYTLKRSESSSTLHHTDPEISIIEDRYRMLEMNYRRLLAQTRRKAQLFRRQKEDLQQCKAAQQRDKKQIERLRTLIGFVKKTEVSTQTNLKDILQGTSKTENSYRSVGRDRKSPIKTACLLKQYGIAVSTPLKKINSKLRQQQSQAQVSKYKFVPELSLK